MDNADRRACRLLDSLEPRLREMWSQMYPASGRDAPRVYRDYSDRSLYACIIGASAFVRSSCLMTHWPYVRECSAFVPLGGSQNCLAVCGATNWLHDNKHGRVLCAYLSSLDVCPLERMLRIAFGRVVARRSADGTVRCSSHDVTVGRFLDIVRLRQGSR